MSSKDEVMDMFGAEVLEGEVSRPAQSTAVAPVSASGMAMVAPQNRDDMEAMVARAELAIEFQKRILAAALRLTNENDWCKLGKRFFLEHTGAKKLRDGFGVSVYPDGLATQQYMKDDQGEYIVVTVPMRACWHGSEISEKGMCSTRDKLLGTRDGGYKPLSEVSITNITLKAQTSAIRRAVMSVLGLNPTEEDMKAAGLDLQKIANERGVSYASGTQGGGSSTDSAESKDRKAEIGRKIMEMCNNDKQQAGDLLEKLTEFELDGKQIPGKRTLNSVKEKQLFYVERDVNAEYVKWQKAQEKKGGGQ